MNPIEAHEYLGKDLEGKNAIVVDDMIASGGSVLEVAKELKERGAKNVYICVTFALFTEGVQVFEEAYKNGSRCGTYADRPQSASDRSRYVF